MLPSLNSIRIVFLLHVGFPLASVFARSFQAYPKWIPEPDSHTDRAVQRYLRNVPRIQPYYPANTSQVPASSGHLGLMVVVLGTLTIFLSGFCCCCIIVYWRIKNSRVERQHRRVARAVLFERIARLFSRSSVGFGGHAHSCIRPETGSNTRMVSFDSVSPEFRPSAPALPADFENSYEEQHLISFKMEAEKAHEPCATCLEPFGVVDVSAGQCLHVFHTACLKAWLAKEGSQKLCPLCRNPFHGTFEHI